MAARYSIGIDLGTTNSALAFASLVGDARPEILLIPQWESVTRLADDPTLPSFLYLPEEVAAAQLHGPDTCPSSVARSTTPGKCCAISGINC